MSDAVQLSLFFCEDIRMEANGKPFLIGMLAPVMYGGSGQEDYFYLVTSVTSSPKITNIDLELSVTISGPDRDIETQRHSQTIKLEDDEFDADEPWNAWLPLRLAVPNCLPGVKIRADLKSSQGSAWASLAIKASDEPTDEN